MLHRGSVNTSSPRNGCSVLTAVGVVPPRSNKNSRYRACIMMFTLTGSSVGKVLIFSPFSDVVVIVLEIFLGRICWHRVCIFYPFATNKTAVEPAVSVLPWVLVLVFWCSMRRARRVSRSSPPPSRTHLIHAYSHPKTNIFSFSNLSGRSIAPVSFQYHIDRTFHS